MLGAALPAAVLVLCDRPLPAVMLSEIVLDAATHDPPAAGLSTRCVALRLLFARLWTVVLGTTRLIFQHSQDGSRSCCVPATENHACAQVCACMLTQHKAQLDARDKNPGMVRPAQNPYAVCPPACSRSGEQHTVRSIQISASGTDAQPDRARHMKNTCVLQAFGDG